MIRASDLVYSVFIFILCIFASPLVIGFGLLIFVVSGSPVFYTQRRAGYKGKLFTIYKFRTMRKGAETAQGALRKRNEAHGPVFKIHNDPRFTRPGKFLSHTGLDELPQLYNILRGEMALFGPRPLPVEEAAKLMGWMRKRHDIKPGIISPWIFEGYHSRSFDEWMRSDIAYAQTKSVTRDLLLLFKSVVFVLRLTARELCVRLH